MTPQELTALPSLPADHRIAYGDAAGQFGELRLPPGEGPHPVVVLLHGGCWKAAYGDLHTLGPMADALKADGIASWNLEYRRLGEAGAGWPGTFQDVARAVDHLRSLAPEHRLDLHRIVLVGHSAGGTLALWAAGRPRLPVSSPIRGDDPLPVRGAVNLAGVTDLAAYLPLEMRGCGDPVVQSLLGGRPQTVPERYAQASPIELLPLGVPQILVWGRHDDNVPLSFGTLYAQRAQQVGDSVQLVILEGASHFEPASPLARTWPTVREAIRSLLTGR